MKSKLTKVAVLGPGISGKAAAKALKVHGIYTTLIGRERPQDWQLQGDEVVDCLSLEREFSFNGEQALILSPGISREHLIVKEALEKNIKVWSEVELGFRLIQTGCFIGVTGTNGKTTTIKIIEAFLKESGKSFFIGGNIGTPLCHLAWDLKRNQVETPQFIVLELSSFQLESLESFQVDYSAILNLSAGHGERYQRQSDYAAAKFQLAEHTLQKSYIASHKDFIKLNSSLAKERKNKLYFVDEKWVQEQLKELDLSSFSLMGDHNLKNLAFAHRLARDIGLSLKTINKAICKIQAIPHRIELIKRSSKQWVFNDSKSTNMASTLVALDAIKNCPKPHYVIIGGKMRGENDSLMGHINILRERDIQIISVGETMDLHKNELPGTLCQNFFPSLKKASSFINKLQGTILFSPAFPSFDEFDNYQERGDFFRAIF